MENKLLHPHFDNYGCDHSGDGPQPTKKEIEKGVDKVIGIKRRTEESIRSIINIWKQKK